MATIKKLLINLALPEMIDDQEHRISFRLEIISGLNWNRGRKNTLVEYWRLIITDNRTARADRISFFGLPLGIRAGRRFASWPRWRIFVYHSWKASRPVYIFDRVEERPSKLPSNFGRLANRCLNIHGGILMRHFGCYTKHIPGFSTWNCQVKLNFNIL